MAIDDIIHKILSDANLEAESIKTNAHVQEKAIYNSAKEQGEILKNSIVEKTAQKESAMVKKTKTLADGEKKNLLLSKKRAILDNAFKKSIVELCNLPEDKKIILLTSLVKNINEHEGFISPAPGYTIILQNIIKDLGKHFTINKESNIQGGFIFTGKNVEIDCSFESLIQKEVRPAMELKIAGVLFDKI